MDMLKTPSGGSASAGGHIFLLQQPGDGGPQLRCVDGLGQMHQFLLLLLQHSLLQLQLGVVRASSACCACS